MAFKQNSAMQLILVTIKPAAAFKIQVALKLFSIPAF